MSDTPITVAPAIQRLALALAALEQYATVEPAWEGLDKYLLHNPGAFFAVYHQSPDGEMTTENFGTPMAALEAAARGLGLYPHPAIMSLVTALQQARERLAEQHACMVVIKWETDDDGGLRPEEWYESNNDDVLAVIDAALKGEVSG